jgi:Zn-dependent protease
MIARFQLTRPSNRQPLSRLAAEFTISIRPREYEKPSFSAAARGPGQLHRSKRACESLFDLSLHQLIIRLGAALILIAVHGFALAGVACSIGDRGPQYDGRLTLNPLNHFDVLGGLTMIFFQLGWIRPIAIDPSALRLGRIGLVLCVVASLSITLIVAVLLQSLRIPALAYLPSAIAPTIIAILNETPAMGASFAVFNLLPVPPLTGAHFLVAVRPDLAPLLARYGLYFAIALVGLAVLGVPQYLLQPARGALAGLLSSP